MPSRFPSGKSTTKYDKQTPPETLNTLVNIGDRITKITAMVEGPIRKDIDNLDANVGIGSTSSTMTSVRSDLQQHR